jgi:PBP1b-binding outer membrane lipoprotein LpoB
MSKICGIFTYNKKAKNMKKLSLLLVAVVLFQSCTKDELEEITPKTTATTVAPGELNTETQLDSRIVNSGSMSESILKGLA